MSLITFGYVVGTTSAVLFMFCTVPDTLAAFRAKTLSGASWKSPALTAVALTPVYGEPRGV